MRGRSDVEKVRLHFAGREANSVERGTQADNPLVGKELGGKG
jgi:hypothetical protein